MNEPGPGYAVDERRLSLFGVQSASFLLLRTMSTLSGSKCSVLDGPRPDHTMDGPRPTILWTGPGTLTYYGRARAPRKRGPNFPATCWEEMEGGAGVSFTPTRRTLKPLDLIGVYDFWDLTINPYPDCSNSWMHGGLLGKG